MFDSLIWQSASTVESPVSTTASFLIENILRDRYAAEREASLAAQSQLQSLGHLHTPASLTTFGHLFPSVLGHGALSPATDGHVHSTASYQGMLMERNGATSTSTSSDSMRCSSSASTLSPEHTVASPQRYPPVSSLAAHLKDGLVADVETDSTDRVKSKSESQVGSNGQTYSTSCGNSDHHSNNHAKFNGASTGSRSKCDWKLQKKQRKARTAFADDQLRILEETFERQQYLSVKDRLELSAKLNLSDTQVKTWYQNRRTKWKRQRAVGIELLREEANFAAVHNIIQSNPFWLNHLSQFGPDAGPIAMMIAARSAESGAPLQGHASATGAGGASASTFAPASTFRGPFALLTGGSSGSVADNYPFTAAVEEAPRQAASHLSQHQIPDASTSSSLSSSPPPKSTSSFISPTAFNSCRLPPLQPAPSR